MLTAITFLFCLFLARFFYIQVIWEDDLNARALDQWTREIPVSALRGNIYDRNGELLAGNIAAYSLYARANAVTDAEGAAQILAGALSMNYDDLLTKLTDGSRSEIVLVRQAEKSVVEKVEGADLGGVYYARDDSGSIRMVRSPVRCWDLLPMTEQARRESSNTITNILQVRQGKFCLKQILSGWTLRVQQRHISLRRTDRISV